MEFKEMIEKKLRAADELPSRDSALDRKLTIYNEIIQETGAVREGEVGKEWKDEILARAYYGAAGIMYRAYEVLNSKEFREKYEGLIKAASALKFGPAEYEYGLILAEKGDPEQTADWYFVRAFIHGYKSGGAAYAAGVGCCGILKRTRETRVYEDDINYYYGVGVEALTVAELVDGEHREASRRLLDEIHEFFRNNVISIIV